MGQRRCLTRDVERMRGWEFTLLQAVGPVNNSAGQEEQEECVSLSVYYGEVAKSANSWAPYRLPVSESL